jgi:hypothetical protein
MKSPTVVTHDDMADLPINLKYWGFQTHARVTLLIRSTQRAHVWANEKQWEPLDYR